MRTLTFIAALMLSGCASPGVVPGPAPAPVAGQVHQTTAINGILTVGSIMVPGPTGPVPYTWPVKVVGDGSYTWQGPPFTLYFDGDLIVEPVDPYTPQVQQAIADGRMVVRTPSGLSPVGTIEEAKQ